MKRYVEYKDSGIEEIGEIPLGWTIGKLKYYSDAIGDGLHGTPNYDDDGEYYFVNGNNLGELKILIKDNTNKLSYGEYQKYKLDLNNSILISLNGTIGNTSFYEGENIVLSKSAGYINPKQSIDRKYLYYYLKSKSVSLIFELSFAGTTIKNLSLETLRNLTVTYPPFQIQNEIATYLDCKTSALDTLITDKQKLIDLLKEKRQAVIIEAVTKGLDKTAPMKDSGIEWIDEIPEKWEVKKLKHFTKVKDGTHDTPDYLDESESNIPLVTSKDIKNGSICFDKTKYISHMDYIKINSRSDVEKYNVIMPMIGTVGNPAIVISDRAFSIKNVALFKTDNIISAKYLKYFLDSDIVKLQFNLINRGGVQQFVSLDILKNIYIIMNNNIDEIVEYLDSKTSAIDNLVTDITSQIEKLKEYRQCVISEAVTGKVAI